MALGVLPAKPNGQQGTTKESSVEIERKEQSYSIEGHMANGAGPPTLEQEIPMLSGDTNVEESQAERNKPKLSKTNGVLLFLLLVSFFGNVYQYLAGCKAGKYLPAVPGPSNATSCPQDWKQNEDQCYFFSDIEGTWNFSQRFCSCSGGSLVTVDSQPEMDYVMRSKHHEYCWIGLHREDVGHPWKLPNGSFFSNWFPIKGEGSCAYLSEKAFSSTWCTNKQYWICSKPLGAVGEKH